MERIRGLYSGSEDYRIIARNFFTPSLFIFLTAGASILCSYSLLLDGYGRGAGIFLIILSAASFPVVYLNSLNIAAGAANGFRARNICRAVLLAFIAASLSFGLYKRIGSICDGRAPLPQSDYYARVEQVIDRRYDQQALLQFHGGRTNEGTPSVQTARHRGIAYISGESDLNVGDEVRFAGKPVFVAHANTTSPFYRSLLVRGISYLFYLKSESVSLITSEKTAKTKVREALSASCDALFDKETSSVVKALYFGNQNYISKSILNDFKRAGVLHVLSASGLHVGVVAAIPLFVLALFRLNRKCILAVSALAIGMYLYITDMPVSLFRAAIMFMIYALHRAADREVNIVNALFLSAIIILAIYPYEIYGLEFQLSFGATLGILLFYRLYRRIFSYLPSKISDSLAITIAAQVPIIPVLAFRLGEINLPGILSNIVVVPAMSLLLVVSLAANGLFIFTGYAAYIGRLADLLFAANKYAIGLISGLDCHFHLASVHPALFAAFAMLLFPLLPWSFNKKIMSLSIAAAFIAAWLLLGGANDPGRASRLITHGRGAVLLVRQGSGLLVIGDLPDMSRIELVTQAIAAMPCREIVLYIPNPDYANIAGFSYLTRRFPVRRCYLSGAFSVKNHTRKFFKILDRDGVELILHDFNSGGAAAGSGAVRPGPGPDPERLFARYRLRPGR